MRDVYNYIILELCINLIKVKQAANDTESKNFKQNTHTQNLSSYNLISFKVKSRREAPNMKGCAALHETRIAENVNMES